jgi:hypothetical protein
MPPLFRQSKLAQASLVDHEEPLAIVISTSQNDDGKQRSTPTRYRTWIGLGALVLLLVVIVATVMVVILTSSPGEDDAVDSPLEQQQLTPPNAPSPSQAPIPPSSIFNMMKTNAELEIIGRTAELTRVNDTLLDTSRTFTVFAADLNAFLMKAWIHFWLFTLQMNGGVIHRASLNST